MKYLIIPFLLLYSVSEGYSQALVIDWQQCYGGTHYEGGSRIIRISDGFILLCSTNSADENVQGNHGAYDYWLLKIDSAGNILWTKTYGGLGDDLGKDMKKTPDGGFILFGTTFTTSTIGQVTGNHGGSDFWIAKTDSLGNLEWGKCLGGSCNDDAYQFDLTADSGYICVGYSCSNDGDVSINYGGYDAWVVKLDHSGNIKWQKSFGGTMSDWGLCIHSTADGGAIVGGLIDSDDGNIQCNYHGNGDAWIVKLDSSGNTEWQKCYGGSEYESAISILPTQDGGYIFIGQSSSNDGDVSGNHGSQDLWVVKLDHWGTIEWQKCFGGSFIEGGFMIKAADDANYFVGGLTFSNDGDVSGNHSVLPDFYDAWLIKISPDGDLIWQRCLGGLRNEGINDLVELSASQLMLLGRTDTDDLTGDVNCTRHGSSTEDVWLLSVTDTTSVGINPDLENIISVSAYPNPSADEITIEYSFTGNDPVSSLMIFNQLGKFVGIIPITEKKGKIHWSTANVSSGIYYYKVSTDQISCTGKIVVLK